MNSFDMTLFEEFIVMFGSWQVPAAFCFLTFVIGISFGLINTWLIKMVFIGVILYFCKSQNTPLLPPKICIGIVFDFSWVVFM